MQALVDEFETRFHPRGLTTQQRNLLIHKTEADDEGPEDPEKLSREKLVELHRRLKYTVTVLIKAAKELEENVKKLEKEKSEILAIAKKLQTQNARLIKEKRDYEEQVETQTRIIKELQSKIEQLEKAEGYSDFP